jgi:hypothetical protein
VFLGLAGTEEEVILELFVVFVRVFLVDLEGGEGQLSAVDEGGLVLCVCEVVKGETSLLATLVHQCFQVDQVSKEDILACVRIGLLMVLVGYATYLPLVGSSESGYYCFPDFEFCIGYVNIDCAIPHY